MTYCQINCQLHSVLERDILPTMIHALVTSRQDYCNAFYMGLPLSLFEKQKLVQNAAPHLQTQVPYLIQSIFVCENS